MNKNGILLLEDPNAETCPAVALCPPNPTASQKAGAEGDCTGTKVGGVGWKLGRMGLESRTLVLTHHRRVASEGVRATALICHVFCHEAFIRLSSAGGESIITRHESRHGTSAADYAERSKAMLARRLVIGPRMRGPRPSAGFLIRMRALSSASSNAAWCPCMTGSTIRCCTLLKKACTAPRQPCHHSTPLTDFAGDGARSPMDSSRSI